MGTLKVGYYAQHVEVAGNYAYVAEFYSGLRICDISNPARPLLLSGTNNNYGAYTYGLAVSGNYLYLADGGAGMLIYQLSAPLPPLLVLNKINGNDVLTWPAPTAAFNLQQSSVVQPTNWASISNVPVVLSNQNQITLPSSANTTFYRLQFP